MMNDTKECDVTSLYKLFGIHKCDRKDSEISSYQYAALDSHIEHLELPFIEEHSFCGIRSIPKFCIKPQYALQISILAIIGTYTKFNNLIFFTDNSNDISIFLKQVSKLKLSAFLGTIIHVSPSVTSNNFKVESYSTNTKRELTESNMIKFVSNFTNVDTSLTFYLDSKLCIYSTHLHNSKYSMWISKHENSMQLIGDEGHRVMPMLYATPTISNLLGVNIGRAKINTQSPDVLHSQLGAVVSSIMSGLSKDNLCYCCAYMKKIHTMLCYHEINSIISFDAKLLVSFTET